MARKKITVKKANKVERKPLTDWSYQPLTNWDVASVRSTLLEHETGTFTRSGKLADNVQRDPRVKASLNTRVLRAIGLPFNWKWPEGYSPTKEDLDRLDLLKKYWKDITGQPVLATILSNVIMVGFSICNVVWDYNGEVNLPKISEFHASNTQNITGTYKVFCTDGVYDVKEDEDYWLVFKLFEKKQPWMHGAIRCIAIPWLQKQYALADWRNLSATAKPIRILTMPPESATPPEEDSYNFIKDIALAERTGAPVLLPNGATLTNLEANTGNSSIFKDSIEQANNEIVIGILGQNLTTEIKGGSYSAASVHYAILQEYLEADVQMLNESMYKIVQSFYKYNFEQLENIPIPNWDATPIEDMETKSRGLKEKAQSISILADALTKLKDLGVNQNMLLKEFGLALNE